MKEFSADEEQQVQLTIERLRNLVDVNPSNAGAWLALAELLATRATYDEATETIKHAIEADPRDNRSWLLMAQVIMRQHGVDTALGWLQDSISVNPHLPGPIMARGWILAGTDQLDAAIDCYQDATEKFPEEWKAFSDLGIIFLRRGECDSARFYLEKAAKLESEVADIWFYLSSAYLMTNAPDDAAHAASRAILLDADNAPCYVNRAEAYEKLGQLDLALADCLKAEELKPGNPVIREIRQRVESALAAGR